MLISNDENMIEIFFSSTSLLVKIFENQSEESRKPLTKLQSRKPVTCDENNWELIPPDGGWGWLILAGSMLVNLLVPGTVKSFGVLFMEFLEAFDASPSTALWIPALCYFLYSSLGKFFFFIYKYHLFISLSN